MKHFLLSFFILCAMMIPSLSHAQYFGGRDVGTILFTCSIPSFVPSCSFVPTPPSYAFDFFGPFYLGGAPLWGVAAMSLSRTAVYTGNTIFPGEWVLGALSPTTAVGGFFIPAIPLPSGGCIPSQCIVPGFPWLGVLSPASGAAIGGW